MSNYITDNYALYCGDCIDVWRQLPDDSIDFIIYSPPFTSLYIYSDSVADMGNAADEAEFFEHYGYLLPEMYRTTVPGRLTAVHCKDLPLYRGRDGAAGLIDFPGKIIAAHEKAGWTYHSRVTIWKCPVIERERTNNNGLLHKTVCRDSSQIRQGMADYLLVFRKAPLATEDNLSDKPIARPHGMDRWVGDPEQNPLTMMTHPSPYARLERTSIDPMTLAPLPMSESIALWRRYAEPVWWDIDQTDVLNYEMARGENDERHVCPLQKNLIRRAIYLWSNPGDTVASPFAGIGSEGVVAIDEGRKFVGAELKQEYFDWAVKYLNRAVEEKNMPMLFDKTEPAHA